MRDQERQITGLTQAEVKERLDKFGPNQISKPKKVSFWSITKEEITEPMILLLLIVGFFYSLWGKLGDALTIFIIIILLVLAEVWNEYRAKKAIVALVKIAAPKTKVLREGVIQEIKTEEVVPDDILILVPGTRVAADSRLLSAFNLEVDESSLTGESFPQEKGIDDEIYAGTLVVAGEGKARVFLTGKETRFGKISALAREIKEPKTPLQLAMKSLTKSLVWVALVVSVVIPLAGVFRGGEPRQMVLIGLSLAFAVIPEELPIIITMVLGLGAYRLSQGNFLVKRIKAAETLGSATVILTDKTGTITESELKVVNVFPEDQGEKIFKTALGALTEFSLAPTDKAILKKARELKIIPLAGWIYRQRMFGNGRKTQTLLRKKNDNFELYIIGAPEEILNLTVSNQEKIREELKKETAKGRRVIGVASKIISDKEKDLSFEQLERNFSFAGLLSFEDSPRKGVKETIEKSRQAGIKTIMVTGDHPKTASFIAQKVGIPSKKVLTGNDLDKLSDEELRKVVKEVSVFARTTPEHKYRLVKALKQNGEIVAVTGDGINDTLALKGADIGIAMGIKGTDAAKEAADVVLADDNFVGIAQGIFEGRKFFDNLSKGVKYYLSVKFALILLFLLPVIIGLPFPFAPIQIIILELFMDLAASAGFVAEPEEKNIYERPPRNPKEKFLNWSMVKGIIVSGLSLFVAVAITYFYGRSKNFSQEQTQTLAFVTWIIAHLFLAFISRSEKESLFRLGLWTNKIMNLWAFAVLIFLLFVMQIPTLGYYFKLTPLSFSHFLLILIVAFVAIFWQEFRKILFSLYWR